MSENNAQREVPIPQWLFFPVARAILRVLSDETSIPTADFFPSFLVQIELNKNAAITLRQRVSRRQCQIIVGIALDILRRVGIVDRRAANELRLTDAQMATKRPSGLPNDLIAEIYREYLRWAEVRPGRYVIMLPEAVQLAYQFPVSIGVAASVPRIERPPVRQKKPGERYAVHRVFIASPIREEAQKQQTSLDKQLTEFRIAEISVPDVHQLGKFERPPSFLRIRIVKEDRQRHISILDQPGVSEQAFRDGIAEMITEDKAALVFVHGYNTTRDDATRRTAQLAHDLAFHGPAVTFSWNDRGQLDGYLKDSNDVRWAARPFLRVIQLLGDCGVESVFVIAHSMGAQVVSDACESRYAATSRTQISSLVLAAADIDRDVFEARRLGLFESVRDVTTYASAGDAAMALALAANGLPRVGDANDLRLYEGVDSVDATDVDTDWFGHGYFVASTELINDIRLLFSGEKPPRKALEEVISANNQRYWRFPKPLSVFADLQQAFY